MGLVYDKKEEELKPIMEHLKNNKMSFGQFLRTVNFIKNMTQEELNNYINAHSDSTLNSYVWH